MSPSLGAGQLWEVQSRDAPRAKCSCSFLLLGQLGSASSSSLLPSLTFPALVCPQQPHKAPSLRKLPVKKDMKEQEKGDGSDGKESLKTKSDESGEEKNGDDDNQKSAQKKKGKAGAGGDCPPQAQLVSSFPTYRQVEASSSFPGGLAAGHDLSAGTAVGKGVCRLQVSFWW